MILEDGERIPRFGLYRDFMDELRMPRSVQNIEQERAKRGA